MQFVKSLIVIFCYVRLNFAAVRSCIEEDVKNRLCFKSMDGSNVTYVAPYPLVLNTTVILREIIDINEKESSMAFAFIHVLDYVQSCVIAHSLSTK